MPVFSVQLFHNVPFQNSRFPSKMSRLLEACPFECLQNVDLNEKRNKIASIASGFLFFSGWWFAIDASATYYEDTRDVFHLCGVFATISMFMVNAVSNSLLRGEGFTDGCLGPVGARIWFFFGFMMGFGSLLGNYLNFDITGWHHKRRVPASKLCCVGSAYILFGEYVHDDEAKTFNPKYTYPGVAFFMQNLFIFFASVIYKFGRSEDMWG